MGDNTLSAILDKSGEVTECSFLNVKVLDVSTPITYNNKKGANNTMLSVTIADSSAFCNTLVYDCSKFPLFKTEECLILHDFIKKDDGTIIITQKSSVFATSMDKVTVPQEIKDKALQLHNAQTDLITAIYMPPKTKLTVKGKIVSVGNLTTKRKRETQEEISFKQLKLKDKTSSVKIALWRNMASTPVKKGDYVMLNNFFKTSTYDDKLKTQVPVLSNTTEKSSIEFLQTTESDDISSSEDEIEIEDINTGHIIGIQNIFSYRCCLNAKCNRKKILNNMCNTCKIRYTENSAGYAVILKILLKTNNDNMHICTVFSDAVQQFLDSKGIDIPLSKPLDIMSRVKQIMPIAVKFTMNGDKINELKSI